MKIAIAVSGGVDSLYALISLKDAGHDVAALHARFLNVPKDKDPVPMLSSLCKEWDIPLHIVDLKEDFSKNVIRPFLESYAKSETPNPCALCNKSLKFGRLLDIARNLSVESLATGHYVNMSPYFCGEEKEVAYGLCLQSAQDASKDQSYFLALTPIEKLRFAQFPLANKMKKDIVEELRQRNVAIPIQKESQEVCFVPNDNYREFIEMERDRRNIIYQGEGDIIYRDNECEKKISTHAGLWRYTEGQRKGLGIAWTEPLYVIEKNEVNNILYVGTRAFLDITCAYASSLNFLVSPEYWHVHSEEAGSLENGMPASEHTSLFVRTRFREKPSPARVFLQRAPFNEKSTCIELGTKTSFRFLQNLREDKITSKKVAELLENREIGENRYLWHVQEEDRFEKEEEQAFSQERAFWNALSSIKDVRLFVKFLSPKQVYAKGQVLAVYDREGFLLVGGILE